MLYTVFVYQAASGLIYYKKAFESDIGGKSELFSSFFSAIQNMLTNMASSKSKSSSLQSLKLGTYVIHFAGIPALDVDFVAVADTDDEKEVKKFVKKFIPILDGYADLFQGDWDGNLEKFQVLDEEVIHLLLKFKKLSKNIKKSEVNTVMSDNFKKLFWREKRMGFHLDTQNTPNPSAFKW